MEKTSSESFKKVLKSIPSIRKQLSQIDFHLLEEQKKLISETPEKVPVLRPYTKSLDAHKKEYKEVGEALLREGKVGCILVAGGQGTRLGFSGPKGCLPFTLVKKKNLFQFFSEKVKAASDFAEVPLKMAIMTSPKNHTQTVEHFSNSNYFGLSQDQIFFFQQGELPFLTPSGELFFEDYDKIALGPDGNGSSITNFFQSSIANEWEKAGIQYITYILVDNPLADPFDPYLIGAHACNGVDVTIKCLKQEDSHEKLGVIMDKGGRPYIIEYSELSEDMPKTSLANISLFCFSHVFLAKSANKKMPLHKAFKKSNYVNKSGKLILSETPCVWKFERFIFDILEFSQNSQVVIYPREECFAPIKDKIGKYGVHTAALALSARDRNILRQVTGRDIPSICLEIDPHFYYPTEKLLKKWSRQKIPLDPYVES